MTRAGWMGVLVGAMGLVCGAASADGVRFSVRVGGGYCAPPVYGGGWGYGHRPVYVAARPAYVRPVHARPVYVQPVYCEPVRPRVTTYVSYGGPAYSRPSYACPPPVYPTYGATYAWSSSGGAVGYGVYATSGYSRPVYGTSAYQGRRYERGCAPAGRVITHRR